MSTSITRRIEPAYVDDRERLEAQANRVRARLAETLEALERRRHDLFDLGFQARRHVGLTLGALAGLALAAGAAAAFASYRARTRGPRLRQERLRAVGRLWRHPDRVASERAPVLPEIGRRLLITGVTYLLTQVVRRRVRRALPAARPVRAELGPPVRALPPMQR